MAHESESFTPKTHMLCKICQQVGFDRSLLSVQNFGGVIPHHGVIGEIVKTADQGCHLCSLLISWRNRKFELEHDLLNSSLDDEAYTLRLTLNSFQVDVETYLSIEMVLDESSFRLVHLKVRDFNGMEKLFPGVVQQERMPLSTSTNSDTSFQLAKSWLAKCREEHASCGVSNIYMPTRLVQASMADGQHAIRVIECSELERSVPYLTLSHCWGDQKPLQLTKANHDSMKKNIQADSLPRTFFDALTITRRLGFNHIWIDSLCIVQDDYLDWSREAALMSSVYGNSILTIAALHGQNSASGCFHSRQPLSLTPCILTSADDSTPLFAWPETHSVLVQKPCLVGPSASPLHKRAWVVQERTLSPRTLYYDSDILFWECIEGSASELQQYISGNATQNKLNLKVAFHKLLSLGRGGRHSQEWHTLWWSLVTVYTSGALTFHYDRWIAFYSIVLRIEQSSGFELYGGLWRERLTSELLWFSPLPAKRHVGYTSWTWLNHNAEVRNLFMQLFSGSNFWRPTVQLSLSDAPKPEHAAEPSVMDAARSENTPTLTLRGYNFPVSWWVRTERLEVPEYALIFPIDGIFVWYPDEPPEEGLKIWCFHFGTSYGFGFMKLVGLVVTPIEGEEKGEAEGEGQGTRRWRRVGAWRGMFTKPEEQVDMDEMAEGKITFEQTWCPEVQLGEKIRTIVLT